MHEMALVTDILDTVCAYAEKEGAKRVVGMTLVCGEVRDIHEDLLQRYVDWFSRGTLAEGIAVKMLTVPLRFRCRECGEIYRYDLKSGAILDEDGTVLEGPGASSDIVDLGEEDSCGCQGHAHHVEKVRPHCLGHPQAVVDVTTGYELTIADISIT